LALRKSFKIIVFFRNTIAKEFEVFCIYACLRNLFVKSSGDISKDFIKFDLTNKKSLHTNKK